MSGLVCEQCPTPLSTKARGGQGRFCSRRCHAASRALAPITCPTCRRTVHPLRRSQVYCRLSCVPQRPPLHPPTKALAVLAVFEANRHSWLTATDISYWVYGDAGKRNEKCVRQILTRLRGWGHTIESRLAPWATFDSGPRRAYRLAEIAREVAA